MANLKQQPELKDQVVGGLHPSGYNPRTITPEGLESLAASLREFGDLSGIVRNTRTDRLVGGHQRVKVLDPEWIIKKEPTKDPRGTVALGYVVTPWGSFSYREVNWPEDKEIAANISANKARSDWNTEALAPLLLHIDQGAFDLSLVGFTEKDLKQIVDIPGRIKDREDKAPPIPKNPITKLGDIWKLGRHRILCGDSTDAKTAKKAFGDKQAVMMLTDPPYGVNYTGGTMSSLKIKNDTRSGPALDALLAAVFATSDALLAAGSPIYVFHPSGGFVANFIFAFTKAGWRIHNGLVWVKDSMVIGHSDYHYKHEPILFGYKAGEGRIGRGWKGWYGDNSQGSVFEVPRPKFSPDHPTMKPTELIEIMVKNSAPTDGVVLDPFLGSGSTLIACQNTMRICYGIEIDPRFCDVAVERWETMTGEKAKR